MKSKVVVRGGTGNGGVYILHNNFTKLASSQDVITIFALAYAGIEGEYELM